MRYVSLVLMLFGFLAGGMVLASSQDVVIIDDPSFVRLVAHPNPDYRLMWATDYVLEVQAMDPAKPVEVSYLLLDSSGTPESQTSGVEVRGNEFIAGWNPGRQYYFHTEVGGWARPELAANPQYFPFPHYRTLLLVLARYEKIYAVFLRENDGQVTFQVLQGGPFQGLEVPGLGRVTMRDGQFEVLSFGEPIEVGLWAKGEYLHDEVAGFARPEFAQNPKYYPIPHYGLFMLMIARYGKIGVIIGNENDGRIGTIVLSGSQVLGEETIPGLCTIRGLSESRILVKALGGPVEVTHFGFDNTCYQWEVGGWAHPGFRENPQVLPLRHYTPGFFILSRYDRIGVFFYNENDGILGILPVRGTEDPEEPPAFRSTEFTFRLLGEIAEREEGNVLLSPYSLVESFSMILGGACGETERVLSSVLGFEGCSGKDAGREWARLREALKALGKDSGISFEVANALWGQRGIAFRDEFLKESETLFGAHLEVLDFGDPRALERINAWVQDTTYGRIEWILERLNPEDILVLTNATFFKAQWTRAFDPGQTRTMPFSLLSGCKKDWPMMAQEGVFPYFEDDVLQAVALPYGVTGRVRMCLLVPRPGVPWKEFLSELNAWNWAKWCSSLKDREGVIMVPRFTLEYGRELKEDLASLDMGIAFSPSASFCHLVDGAAFISSVKHRTFIEVNEEGTEAAGTTAVVIAKGLGDLFHLVADRPFFFAIEDKATGTLLFMGLVVDPEGDGV